jgi:hypothetical protein
VETYEKNTLRMTKKNMVRCCGRGLKEKRDSRLERIIPG